MDTLVLSQGYAPVRLVPWYRSINWILSGRAIVLEEYDDKPIQSFSETFKTPAVVRYTRGKFFRQQRVRVTKRNIWLRDQGHCQYCGKDLKFSDSTVDHVFPRSRGGEWSWTNLVTSCKPCNQRKGCKTLQDSRMKLLSTPDSPESLPGFAMDFMRWRDEMPKEWRDFFPN